MNSIISEAVDPENYKFSITKLLRILSRAHFRGQQLCFVPATKDIVYAKLCANRRNNPNFVGPTMNNVGSCCVSASSGVQTDASTPNNVGTCIASWEGYNPYGFGNHV